MVVPPVWPPAPPSVELSGTVSRWRVPPVRPPLLELELDELLELLELDELLELEPEDVVPPFAAASRLITDRLSDVPSPAAQSLVSLPLLGGFLGAFGA